MNQIIPYIGNLVTGVISGLGNRYATNSERIQQNAVFVEETKVSIQPQVMAGATLLLVVALIVLSRRK
jgi:uncharacterized membrane protein YukC